jgi:alpha-galactosidase/6-phospho-beta-glucosidase family protein
MQAIREARETGGKTKETSFRVFGLNEKLFTPKFEQTRNENTFKKVLKVMEEDIQEKEQQRLVF